MKLILQAIKALFRKVENAISHNVAKLQKQIDSVKSTATTAKSTAEAAQAKADNAKETAEAARTVADTAVMFKGLDNYSLYLENNDIAAGESSKIKWYSTDLQQLLANAKKGDILRVGVSYKSQTSDCDLAVEPVTDTRTSARARGLCYFDMYNVLLYIEFSTVSSLDDMSNRIYRII